MGDEQKRPKAVYVGAPAIFALEMACQHITEAFGGFGCYLVGSSLQRPDWRDVDIRFILSDEEFGQLFPNSVDSMRTRFIKDLVMRWD